MPSKKFVFFLYMYKIQLISAEGYKNAKIDAKIVRKTGEIWDVGSGMGFKNISDLGLNELRGVLKTKNLQKNRLANTK